MIPATILKSALLAACVTAFSGTAFAAGPDTFMNGQSFYGQPANPTQATRLVDIASTNRVSINYGETVKFVSGGKTFAWTFNGLSPRAVNLSKIAPQDFSGKPLTLYIKGDPYNRR